MEPFIFILLLTTGGIFLYKYGLKEKKDKNILYKEWKDDEFKKMHKYYKKYMQSEKWKKLKNKRLKLDNYSCTKCRIQSNLICHHLTYKNLGEEKINDITTLCLECHQNIHDKVGYPSTYDCYKLKKFY